jgi:hypothetical protein
MREIAEERRVLVGFLVTVASAALALIPAVISAVAVSQGPQLAPPDMGLPPGFEENVRVLSGVFGIVVSTIAPFVWWAVVSLLMQLITGFFGGRGPLPAMFATVGVAMMPFAVASLAQIPISGLQLAVGPESPVIGVLGLLSFLLSLAALIWHVALVVIGAALARGVGYGESAGSCAISCAGCGGLIILVVVVIAVVAGVIAGSAAPQ